MERKKTVLVIDSSAQCRKDLRDVICAEYNVVEADNGVSAAKILRRSYESISGVILDDSVPDLNVKQALKFMSGHPELCNIPVIISTANYSIENEKNALECGAWDIVPKPYDEDIIKFRLKNAIERSQLTFLERLQHMADFDALTGIYSRFKFYDETQKMLAANPDTDFVLMRFDIDRFSLINSFFGTQKGDELLIYIADVLKKATEELDICTYGRINGDVFAVCMKYDGKESVESLSDRITENLKKFPVEYNIVATYGMYIVKDRSIPVSEMYDKATLASKKVKNSFIHKLEYYEDNMSEDIEREQRIINEMENALEEEQFVVYLQPKYDIRTNEPAGAEALVRWIHPDRGIVPPGVFIPVFERNGFISKLDYYMWEKVCKLIRSWIDRGVPVYPVSVNVSRVNIYNPKLADLISGLVEKYDIPPEYFNLELTESAYMEKNELIDETLTKLQERGFVILMDDFGSGYSSLNTLKDISVDVLKIDMKFMSKAKKEGRAENIIASVVRMAKWLDLPVIAEGVEEKQQVDFLRIVGCEYVQGFYFAKPMPVEEYEQLIMSRKKADIQDLRCFCRHTDDDRKRHKGVGKCTVLIADNSDHDRRVLKKILARQYAVIETDNAEDAYSFMEKRKADLIVISLDLPERGGRDFLKKRRDSEILMNIPVVVYSGEMSEKEQSAILELGADDFISKPFIPKLVLNRVGNIIDLAIMQKPVLTS